MGNGKWEIIKIIKIYILIYIYFSEYEDRELLYVI